MTEELKQAAQAALEALKNVTDYDQINAARRALERALTQRPAAQTEREAFEAWYAALPNNGRKAGLTLLDAWQARASLPAPQQATPEPVGEPVARVELMQTGGNAGLATRIVEIDDPLRERLRPGDVLYDRPAPGVPEDSELLDYLDTLATRAAGSDLHCFGGRVALYVRTGIGSQIEASGAGTAREAIRAALAAAQAKGGCDGA